MVDREEKPTTTLTMTEAIVTICEGASTVLIKLKQNYDTKKKKQMKQVQDLRKRIEDLQDEDLQDRRKAHDFSSEVSRIKKEIHDESQELSDGPSDGNEPNETKATVLQQPCGTTPTAGYPTKAASPLGLLESIALKKTLHRHIQEMEESLQLELDSMLRKLQEKGKVMKMAQQMFYGAVESCQNNIQSSENQYACTIVVEMARSLDEGTAQAAMAMSELLVNAYKKRKEEGEIPEDILWSSVTEWETFHMDPYVTALLDATWNSYTEVDILAAKAADGDTEAVEYLRQLLCVREIYMAHSLRCHVRRVIIKAAEPYRKEEWPTVTRPRVLRCVLHIVRNGLLNYLEAKHQLEFYADSPLFLPRRQAIINIGEMALHGHKLANDYLLDTLCNAKDWSTRQIALARASRLLVSVPQKDKPEIATKLVTAILNDSEVDVVRETAETVLTEALQSGLKKDAVFVDTLMRTGAGLLQSGRPSQRAREAWERIRQGAEVTEGRERRPKKMSLRSLKDEMYQRELDREKKELEKMHLGR